MAAVLHHKLVNSLPGTLQANSVYYVRTGTGFDAYVTNNLGIVVAYPLNLPVVENDTFAVDGGGPGQSYTGTLQIDFGGVT